MNQPATHPAFFTLLLMISFASVNAVLFTPALPKIAEFFAISHDVAQLTITWFLIGYAVGQLIYGPIANRYGRKNALYAGIGLQIISSLGCAWSSSLHSYPLLVIGRFLLALGSGVGLKMTFTLVNECYTGKIVSQKISYLTLAFAITPGLAVALGGLLNTYYSWTSCFYAGALYGVLLLILVIQLPESQSALDKDAFKLSHLLPAYSNQFKNVRLIIGGLLMGASTSFIYIFAASAPFIAMNLLGMDSLQYGFANLLPPIGLMAGSLFSARYVINHSLCSAIKLGVTIVCVMTALMIALSFLHLSALGALFLPMMGIYFGLSLILPNASTIAMGHTQDKAHGSAVMNFVNMGLCTVVVLSLSFFPITVLLLPLTYLILCGAMLGIYAFL